MAVERALTDRTAEEHRLAVENLRATTPDATPPRGEWTDFFLGQIRELDAEVERLRLALSHREAVLHWLEENHPRALDLCPWKIASEAYRG